ncbi:MAG: ArsR/SmtB family transcription factor [Sandaracinaceae bacterium]
MDHEPPPHRTEALSRHLRPEVFKALADASRLSLLARLAATPEPLNVSAASDCCGVHVSGTSRHLKMLERAGVVVAERRGREVVYRLAADQIVGFLRGLADALEACCGASSCCGPVPARGGA